MKRRKKKCDKCDKEISLSNYNKHYRACGKQKKKKVVIDDNWKIADNEYKCPYCNGIYPRMGIGTHIWMKHSQEGILFNNNRIAWNKGLTKEMDKRVAKFGNTYSKRCKSGEIVNGFKGKQHTKRTKELLSHKLSLNHKGGRCKWYKYEKTNGMVFSLQGTWEVRFAKVLDILDEDWIKPGNNIKEHTFEWVDNVGQKHYYTPDFWSPKLKKYFEVKGYWWGDDKEKMKRVKSQVDINVDLIFKKQLENYEKLIS